MSPVDLEKIVRAALANSEHEYAKKGATDPQFVLHDWVDEVTQNLLVEINNQVEIAKAAYMQHQADMGNAVHASIVATMDAFGADEVVIDLNAQRTIWDRLSYQIAAVDNDRVKYTLVKKGN